MASLRRFPKSRYWYACFLGPDGRPRQCSTKEIERRRAQKIADRYEEAARLGRLGLLSARQARRVIGEVFEISNRQALPNDTVRGYFTDWLITKKLSAGRETIRYDSIVKEFLRWLGPLGNNLLSHLTSNPIAKFRDHLVPKQSPATVNVALACIQSALQRALRNNLIDINEAARVDKFTSLVKRSQSQARRPFTHEEMRALLKVADPEWKGMVLCGAYHGLRLGDVSLLSWPNVVLEARELRFKTEKTGREMVIPIAEPFYRYLLEIAGDDPLGPLFPKAFGLRQRKVPTSALSNQFYRLITTAGVVKKRTNKRKKEAVGRSGRKQRGGVAFHCRRHTATTLLTRAGASDVVAREIIGHETAAVSRTYSLIDTATF